MYGLDMVGKALLLFMVATFILLPFGIWKIAEIILWIITHIRIVA